MGKPLPGIELRIEEGELLAARRRPARPSSTATSATEPLRRASGGATGDLVTRGRRRLPLVRGPQRRLIVSVRLPDRPVRGRVGAASAIPPSPRPPRWPRPTPSAARSCAPSSSCATGEPDEAMARELQEHVKSRDRAVQVPADRRVRRRAAEDGERKDPPRRAARCATGVSAPTPGRTLAAPRLRGPLRHHAADACSASARRCPILPRYVQGPIGSGDVAVGIVTGAFAITGLACRPLAGSIADRRGRKPIVRRRRAADGGRRAPCSSSPPAFPG